MNFQDINAGPGATQIIHVNAEDPRLQLSLFKTSNYESFKNVNPERVRDTCLWFLGHEQFTSWRDNSNTQTPVLWLSTDPGCGKSVLSRALIDERLLSTGTATICYFFFKDNGEQAKITTALCALLHQFFWAYQDLFQKHVALAVKKCGKGLRNDFEELWRVFESAVTDEAVGDVICLLDALDECHESDRKPLFDSIRRFYRQNPTSKLKFLVTSRPYHEIERGLWNISKICLSGEDESAQISKEIAIVIDANVEDIAKKVPLDEKVIKSLKNTIISIPNRTYLWVHLTLDQIENVKGSTEQKVLDAINRLPRTVEDAYEAILGRCEEENKKETRKALHIIVAAERPLTLAELEVAVAIKPDSTSYKDLDLEKDDDTRKKWIRRLCGLFVSVIDNQVFLIHQTAREFLVQENNGCSQPQGWKHSIRLQEAHETLGKICINQLFFRENGDFIALISSVPYYEDLPSAAREIALREALLKYSVFYWIDHVKYGDIKDYPWIEKTAKLCGIGGGWSWYTRRLGPSSTRCPRETVSGSAITLENQTRRQVPGEAYIQDITFFRLATASSLGYKLLLYENALRDAA